jgi:hypothetical protein
VRPQISSLAVQNITLKSTRLFLNEVVHNFFNVQVVLHHKCFWRAEPGHRMVGAGAYIAPSVIQSSS